jgi:hypothetical protein
MKGFICFVVMPVLFLVFGIIIISSSEQKVPVSKIITTLDENITEKGKDAYGFDIWQGTWQGRTFKKRDAQFNAEYCFLEKDRFTEIYWGRKDDLDVSDFVLRISDESEVILEFNHNESGDFQTWKTEIKSLDDEIRIPRDKNSPVRAFFFDFVSQ